VPESFTARASQRGSASRSWCSPRPIQSNCKPWQKTSFNNPSSDTILCHERSTLPNTLLLSGLRGHLQNCGCLSEIKKGRDSGPSTPAPTFASFADWRGWMPLNLTQPLTVSPSSMKSTIHHPINRQSVLEMHTEEDGSQIVGIVASVGEAMNLAAFDYERRQISADICPLCGKLTIDYRHGHHVCTDRACSWCEWCGGKCEMFTASGCKGPEGDAGESPNTTFSREEGSPKL